jgi:hydrogenase-4 component E
MSSAVDPVLVLILMMNFALLGTSRLPSAINASAVQGVLLGLLALLVNGVPELRPALVAIATISIKGVLIPKLLHRSLREAGIRLDVEPYVGFVMSLILGAIATGAAIVFADRLPLIPAHHGSLLMPASLATVLSGFLILSTRRKAITQVIGYLTLENGIFIMGLTLHETIPMLVEIGVLLDLLVAIFVIGIVINHISREFGSLDVGQLDALRE